MKRAKGQGRFTVCVNGESDFIEEYALAGPHGGRPRRRQHRTATPATAIGQRASPPLRQWPQPLRSRPPAPQCPPQYPPQG